MLRLLSSLAIILSASALAASAGTSVLAQTPPAAATPVADATNTPRNPSPTPDVSRPAPSFTPGPLTVHVTIRLAVSPEGLYQVIPDGTKIQVLTNRGVCVEIGLPGASVQALNTTKQIAAPALEIPERGAPEAGAAAANCPAPGELFTIALVYPNGSYTPLSTGPYNGGIVSAEFVVPAPGPISEGAQLPRTGAGGGDAIGTGYVGLALLLAGIGAFGAGRIVARRAR